jgi:SAM-dependent methyltransferase
MMRLSYEKLYGDQQMLHYPLHCEGVYSLLEGQKGLTEFCVSHVPDLGSRTLLDIGCGNGRQTLHIRERFNPKRIHAIDLNPMHIGLANDELRRRGFDRVQFAVDNAQSLSSVSDSSFDAAVCIESSHHYPDKAAFLAQVHRALRPGGCFVLADLIRKDRRPPGYAEKKLYLFHWHPQQYREQLDRLGMTIETDQDITGDILPAFRSSDRWLDRAPGVSSASHAAGKWIGRAMIAFYRIQLERYCGYHLFVARKN